LPISDLLVSSMPILFPQAPCGLLWRIDKGWRAKVTYY